MIRTSLVNRVRYHNYGSITFFYIAADGTHADHSPPYHTALVVWDSGSTLMLDFTGRIEMELEISEFIGIEIIK